MILDDKGNYDFEENDNYSPSHFGNKNEIDDKIRYMIIRDSYWNAKNLKEIIEASYDISTVTRLPDRKEEVVFSLVALTCELYLKSLIYTNILQKTRISKHNLEDLFLMLEEPLKERLKDLTNEEEFEEELEKNKDVFVNFRYSYELKGYYINASFLLRFMKALARLCEEGYPKEFIESDGSFFKVGHIENGVSYQIVVK